MIRARVPCWFALTSALTACSGSASPTPSADPAPTTSPTTDDCNGRAETVAAGLTKRSANYAFTLVALNPEVPVQSSGPPANSWQVSVADDGGHALVGGALTAASFMPDHGHSGPPAVGVELDAGHYEIDDLILPMPAFYALTLSFTPTAGERQSVVFQVCVGAASQ